MGLLTKPVSSNVSGGCQTVRAERALPTPRCALAFAGSWRCSLNAKADGTITAKRVSRSRSRQNGARFHPRLPAVMASFVAICVCVLAGRAARTGERGSLSRGPARRPGVHRLSPPPACGDARAARPRRRCRPRRRPSRRRLRRPTSRTRSSARPGSPASGAAGRHAGHRQGLPVHVGPCAARPPSPRQARASLLQGRRQWPQRRRRERSAVRACSWFLFRWCPPGASSWAERCGLPLSRRSRRPRPALAAPREVGESRSRC